MIELCTDVGDEEVFVGGFYGLNLQVYDTVTYEVDKTKRIEFWVRQ